MNKVSAKAFTPLETNMYKILSEPSPSASPVFGDGGNSPVSSIIPKYQDFVGISS